MISCTEFIAAYSELFSYIDETYGRDEVDAFWKYLFEPDGKGIPLINFVQKEGIMGCFSYWAGTLNEEAADFTMHVNPKRGYFRSEMHYCPSKGRLLKLQEEIGITPYYDYCLHCDSYRSAVEKVGLKYVFDFSNTHRAACNMLIYDPKVFDGRVILDDDTKTMHRESSDNEYFHPDFHSSLNMGVHYLGKKYGEASLTAYLARYTQNVYRQTIEKIKKEGLSALEQFIVGTYQKEKAPEVLSTTLKEGVLQVEIARCPGVAHLQKTGRNVSPWYKYTTQTVMQTIARESGLVFAMEKYDEATGAAKYNFTLA